MARNFSTPDVTGASVDGTGRRVGIVCARWNRTVTDRLLRGATDTLRTCGLRDDDIDVAWVPGRSSSRWRPRSWPAPAATTR